MTDWQQMISNIGDVKVCLTRVNREDPYMIRVERENPYRFAGQRLEKPIGRIALLDRLAIQDRPVEGVAQIAWELPIYVKLHVMLFQSPGQGSSSQKQSIALYEKVINSWSTVHLLLRLNWLAVWLIDTQQGSRSLMTNDLIT